MSDHSELKRLAEAAIEGPWHIHEERESSSFQGYMVVDPWRCPMAAFGTSNQDAKNAEFVAAANPAEVLALISENKRLAELLECAQGDLKQAMQIIEKLTPQADLYQQVQIAAGSLPSGWEIALRVENGCGCVDLIDQYGTVVDLDNAGESLSESVASAVTFAMSKEGR